MRHLRLIIFILFCSSVVFGQNKRDIAFVDEYFEVMQEEDSTDENPIITAAFQFISFPYVAGTLEKNKKEQLTVNLFELDCTTLVENTLALAQSNQKKNSSYEGFTNELQAIRYREGIIDGYASRLHYISEWIINNEKLGFIKNITCDIGGETYTPKVNYMSTHPDSYPALKDNPEAIEQVKKIEDTINNNENLYYIPVLKINRIADKIEDGDIIFFTTSIKGLDVQHAGIAYWVDGTLTFIHASSRAKKVIIESDSLSTYCSKGKTITGIIVVRPILE